jgi:NMD protein affecting ribosome stability and mRNA decay
MPSVSHKIAVGEKGQRTARSTSVYLPKSGLKDTAVCSKCRLVYQNKRWRIDEKKAEELAASSTTNKGVCPACRRMADNVPAGLISLSGTYLHENRDAILNLVKHVEEKAREKNPLGRIMEIGLDKGVITISTTEDKVAQKIGREIFKAHKGELHYSWSHEQKMVRVTWKR